MLEIKERLEMLRKQLLFLERILNLMLSSIKKLILF